jgi:hypothetical protein
MTAFARVAGAHFFFTACKKNWQIPVDIRLTPLPNYNYSN